jgi:hypothetical protein
MTGGFHPLCQKPLGLLYYSRQTNSLRRADTHPAFTSNIQIAHVEHQVNAHDMAVSLFLGQKSSTALTLFEAVLFLLTDAHMK